MVKQGYVIGFKSGISKREISYKILCVERLEGNNDWVGSCCDSFIVFGDVVGTIKIGDLCRYYWNGKSFALIEVVSK